MDIDSARRQLETVNELVRRAKERLSGVDGVQSVFYSLSGAPETLGEPALVVIAERDLGDLSEHARALGVPLEQKTVEQAKVAAPDPVQWSRGNPPLGGYRASGPRVAGTLGSVGYRALNRASMAFVSAAHVFRRQDGQISDDAWQPLPPTVDDIIGTNPDTTFESVDVIIYRIIPGSRAWVQESRIYGLGLVNGIVAPVSGIEVRKVGAATGLTRGVITVVNGSLFAIESIDGEGPISLSGDSGAIWVDTKNRAVGVHQRGTGATHAFAISMVPIARHGSFAFY